MWTRGKILILLWSVIIIVTGLYTTQSMAMFGAVEGLSFNINITMFLMVAVSASIGLVIGVAIRALTNMGFARMVEGTMWLPYGASFYYVSWSACLTAFLSYAFLWVMPSILISHWSSLLFNILEAVVYGYWLYRDGLMSTRKISVLVMVMIVFYSLVATVLSSFVNGTFFFG